ncbi:nickel/cobalt transporter [Alkalilacustris brevis]|uniref:nickel/cobalt transporter n=1 Tax=Alkalilacustris brevis TaxID=2026338 RepID=UPI000E0D703D|nr:hypothetical protein [Alkalilacustris brevis]
MRKLILTFALLLALGLAGVWLAGGFDLLARWAAEGQRSFQNAMAGTLRQLRAGEAGALAALIGVAFAYGFFHAVGPGHGKILIGGYGAASRVRLAPLAGIALASSLMQATTAVALVYGGVFLFEAGRDTVLGLGEGAMTQASLAAIGAIGLWLVWRGARGLYGLAQVAVRPAPAMMAAGHAHDQGQSHDAAPCADCGHRHGPAPDEVARLRGWRDAALLIGAIAMRPCTGALFLLILTWNMGLQAAGIAGTYAMGLGTAAVTVAVAALSVSARDGALIWAGRLSALRVVVPMLELAAGALVALVAGQMLLRGGW